MLLQIEPSNSIATLIPVFFPTLFGCTIHYMVAGMVVSGIFATILAATFERVVGREVPIAVGFVRVVFGCGQFFGPIAAARVIDLTNSFRFAFVLGSIMMLVGVVLGFILSKSDRNDS